MQLKDGWIRSQKIMLERKYFNPKLICSGWICLKKKEMEEIEKERRMKCDRLVKEVDKIQEERKLCDNLFPLLIEIWKEVQKKQFAEDIKNMNMFLFNNKVRQFDLRTFGRKISEDGIDKLKSKMMECDNVSLNLFKREIRICLGKLKTQEPMERKQRKRIGKDSMWKRFVFDESLLQLERNLGVKMEILTRKVRLKGNKLQGMHRKTRWKGDEYMIMDCQISSEKMEFISMEDDVPKMKYPENNPNNHKRQAKEDLLDYQKKGNMDKIILTGNEYDNRKVELSKVCEMCFRNTKSRFVRGLQDRVNKAFCSLMIQYLEVEEKC
jgi:hypothetical protein